MNLICAAADNVVFVNFFPLYIVVRLSCFIKVLLLLLLPVPLYMSLYCKSVIFLFQSNNKTGAGLHQCVMYDVLPDSVQPRWRAPVSYTHLTLPTKRIV